MDVTLTTLTVQDKCYECQELILYNPTFNEVYKNLISSSLPSLSNKLWNWRIFCTELSRTT